MTTPFVVQRLHHETLMPLPDAEILDRAARDVPLDDAGLLLVLAVARTAVEAMHHGTPTPGVALAFPQVGVSLRGFVYCPMGVRGDERVIVNPSFEPIHRAGEIGSERDEGCLSVLGGLRQALVLRHHRVRIAGVEVVRWWRPRGAAFKPLVPVELAGWEARVWQHACAHLTGGRLGGCEVADGVVALATRNASPKPANEFLYNPAPTGATEP